MIRIKRGNIAQKRHKKILKLAKGFFAAHSKLFRTANAKILKAFYFSYIGRKQKKRYFRKLWIVRINAYFKNQYKIKYSKFINLIKKSKIYINRKILTHLILVDPTVLKLIIATIKE
jgi:large subunit ribosomal protein L20